VLPRNSPSKCGRRLVRSSNSRNNSSSRVLRIAEGIAVTHLLRGHLLDIALQDVEDLDLDLLVDSDVKNLDRLLTLGDEVPFMESMRATMVALEEVLRDL
jgi:hypothetical protein